MIKTDSGLINAHALQPIAGGEPTHFYNYSARPYRSLSWCRAQSTSAKIYGYVVPSP